MRVSQFNSCWSVGIIEFKPLDIIRFTVKINRQAHDQFVISLCILVPVYWVALQKMFPELKTCTSSIVMVIEISTWVTMTRLSGSWNFYTEIQ